MAGACGQTALPAPRHGPCHRAHLRCEPLPVASAQPLVPTHVQPHGGSLRANGPASAPPRSLPSRAPSVRTAAGGFRPTAGSHACSAAWREPAGKRPCQRPGTVFASARTFGANRRRWLPPNRSAAAQPCGGDAAQQELRLPGTACGQKINAIGHWPYTPEVQMQSMGLQKHHRRNRSRHGWLWPFLKHQLMGCEHLFTIPPPAPKRLARCPAELLPAGCVKLASANANGTGLRAMIPRLFHESHFCVNIEFIKTSIEDGVAVEVDTTSFGCFDKAIVFQRKQF